ncbi:MAG: DMT family transporter [Gammaproteobacteria bacterium]|nr:DMT family transporter [Gammaproteobacteria bacterium]
MSRRHALVLLALLAVFWGLNWPIMKIGLTEIPPWVFRALASGVGGLGLLVLARAGRQPLGIPRHELPRLALAALLNITLWNMLILYGIDLMNSGRAAILAYTMPIWASLLGVVVLGEKLTHRAVIALALGIAAMALLFLGGEPGAERSLLGPALVVLGAMSWGAGTVAVKHFRFSMPVTVTTAWQHLIGTLPIAVVAAVWDVDNIREVTLGPALCVVYNMTVTAIFCYWAYFKIVNALPIVACTVGTLMVPVLGVLFTALIFRVPPTAQDYVALAAVVGAVFLVLTPSRR